MDTTLDLKRLRSSLKDSPIGHTIDHHGRIASTMPIAHELARNPRVSAGAIVVAEEQIHGRGRMQRRWQAPYGQGLLVSIIIKDPLLNNLAGPLPILSGVATTRAVAAYHPALAAAVWLKWPNDILLGLSASTAGKVAGILIEAVFERGAMVHAVIGIGINVNQHRDHFPAVPSGAPKPTSLCMFLGSAVDRTELLITLCKQFSAIADTPATSHRLYQEWRSRMSTLGERVVVYPYLDNALSVAGQAVDVTPQGELVVVDDAGGRHTFDVGDVSIRATG